MKQELRKSSKILRSNREIDLWFIIIQRSEARARRKYIKGKEREGEKRGEN